MSNFGVCEMCGGLRAPHRVLCAPCHYRSIMLPEAVAVAALTSAVWAWRLWQEANRCRVYYMGRERCVLHKNHVGDHES